VRALSAHGQAFTVAQAAVAAEIHQALDVHSDFAPEIALNLVLAVNQLAEAQHLIVRELVDAAVIWDREAFANLVCLGGAYTEDIAQPDGDALSRGDIHSCDAGHV
jgi:hypothetical protein